MRVYSEGGYTVKLFFFFSSRRRHTSSVCDWSSEVCSSDLLLLGYDGADEGGGQLRRISQFPGLLVYLDHHDLVLLRLKPGRRRRGDRRSGV